MQNAPCTHGRLEGFCGVLLCLTSAVARLSGHYRIGNFDALTVLQGGIAGMVLGSFCLLVVLSKSAIKQ